MAQLLISGPSRRSKDISVSLRARPGDTAIADKAAYHAAGAGCPDEKLDRIRSSIYHTGRYDCRVATVAVRGRNSEYLRDAFSTLDGEFIVLNDDGISLSEDDCYQLAA